MVEEPAPASAVALSAWALPPGRAEVTWSSRGSGAAAFAYDPALFADAGTSEEGRAGGRLIGRTVELETCHGALFVLSHDSVSGAYVLSAEDGSEVARANDWAAVQWGPAGLTVAAHELPTVASVRWTPIQ